MDEGITRDIFKTDYSELFNFRRDAADFECISCALDDAVQKLRESGHNTYIWATFIHVGALCEVILYCIKKN
jgi:hypothetical protein